MTDGHDGLLAAVKELFAATPRQRCLLHKQRNVLNAVPSLVRYEVETELAGIWAQPTREGALTQLAASTRQIWQALPRGRRESERGGRQDPHLLRLPQTMHRYIRTTNAIESLRSQCSPAD